MTQHLLDRRRLLGLVGLGGTALAMGACAADSDAAPAAPFQLSDAQWRARLSPAQYRVLREEGTERPYSSPLNKEKRAGVFACAGCGQPLFSSATKFESGTGWPSFWKPLNAGVTTREDRSMWMRRTEVRCVRCAGHLGHVFDDGPKPTGKRFCMNGVAMTFTPKA